MRALPLVAIVAIFSSSGCVSGSGSSGADVRRDSNRITAEELQEVPSGNAYDAVSRLRPSWLRSRGTLSVNRTGAGSLPRVFVDNRDYGSLRSLRDFNVDSVGEMEFVTARDATTQYGTGYAGGIIHVRLRRIS